MPSKLPRGSATVPRTCFTRTGRLDLLGALALLLLAAPSCALYGFDEDGGFDLPIAATESFEIEIDLSMLGGGGGATAPSSQAWEIPLQATPIDLASTSKDLDDNKDKLERLEIKAIKVRPLTNSLTDDLPPIQLAIGPYLDGNSESIQIATIPIIPAGSTAELDAEVDKAGTDGAQPYLTSLRFDFVPTAVLDIQQGQVIPSGAAELEITITVQATVDPTK